MEVVDFATVTNRFSHDALGRRVAATDGRGNAVHTDYDAAGRVVAESGAKIEKEKQMPNGIIHMENAFWIFGEAFNGYCD